VRTVGAVQTDAGKELVIEENGQERRLAPTRIRKSRTSVSRPPMPKSKGSRCRPSACP
jgi:hypothetical protein